MINNSSDGLRVIRSEVKQCFRNTNQSWGHTSSGTSPISMDFYFINNTTHDVTTIGIDGIRLVHKCVPTFEGEFIIRIVYNLGFQDYGTISKMRGSIGEMSNDMKIILAAIEENKSSRHYQNLAIAIDHIVMDSDFTDNKGSMYLADCGFVVSSLPMETVPSHPRYIGSVSDQNFYNTLGAGGIDGFIYGIGIELVDDRPGAKPRFTYQLKKVRQIPISKNIHGNKANGIYITVIDDCVEFPSNQNQKIKYYKLEEAESIGIYNSEDEALSAGDVKLLRETEIALLKRETAELTAQFKRAEDERAAEEAKYKFETLRLEQQHKDKLRGYEEAARHREHNDALAIAAVEKRNIELKDFYENKSMQKKDWLETLKIIGTTITTMGVLILGYNKTFGNKD